MHWLEVGIFLKCMLGKNPHCTKGLLRWFWWELRERKRAVEKVSVLENIKWLWTRCWQKYGQYRTFWWSLKGKWRTHWKLENNLAKGAKPPQKTPSRTKPSWSMEVRLLSWPQSRTPDMLLQLRSYSQNCNQQNHGATAAGSCRNKALEAQPGSSVSISGASSLGILSYLLH